MDALNFSYSRFRTGVEIIFGVHYVWQCGRIFRQRFTVQVARNVGAAMADKHTYPRFAQVLASAVSTHLLFLLQDTRRIASGPDRAWAALAAALLACATDSGISIGP